MTATVEEVLLLPLLTAVATGLGALPLALMGRLSRRHLGLVPREASVWSAAAWSVVSSLPQPLLAVPAFLAVAAFAPLLGAGLGFAAGAMVWMALRELIPEALESAPRSQVWGVAAAALLAMTLAQLLLQG